MVTILIDKLNEKQISLVDYLRKAKQSNISLSDAEIREIRETFVVHSMKELIERFEPSITILVKGEQIIVPLCHADGFFQRLISMCEVIFRGEYTDITQEELKDSLLCTENKEDVLSLLHTFLQQAKEYLEDGKTRERRFVVETQEHMSLRKITVSKRFLDSDDDMTEMEKVKIEHNQAKEALLEMNWRDSLAYWCLYLKEKELSDSEKEALKIVYEEQKEVYAELQEQFMWQAKPILQTLIDCYFYLKKSDAGELLITNCLAEELADTKGRKALFRYLDTVNGKQYDEDAITKVILPNVDEDQAKEKLTRERFQASKKEMSIRNNNTVETAKEIQHMFGKYQIETQLIRCQEGKPLGALLTGIDEKIENVSKQEEQLRELCRWLNEWNVQGEIK